MPFKLSSDTVFHMIKLDTVLLYIVKTNILIIKLKTIKLSLQSLIGGSWSLVSV